MCDFRGRHHTPMQMETGQPYSSFLPPEILNLAVHRARMDKPTVSFLQRDVLVRQGCRGCGGCAARPCAAVHGPDWSRGGDRCAMNATSCPKHRCKYVSALH